MPDAVFTSDDGPVQTSYDTPVIDLTEAGPEVVEAPLEADIEAAEDTVIDLGDSASDSLSQGGARGAAADTWPRTRVRCCHAACQNWGLMHSLEPCFYHGQKVTDLQRLVQLSVRVSDIFFQNS